MGATSPQYHYDSPPAGDRPTGPASPRPESHDPYALLDQLPGAIVLLDPSGRVVHLNGIAELRLDVVRAEALGRDLFRELIPQLESDGLGEQFRAAMLGGRASLAYEVSLEDAARPRRLSLGIRSCVHEGTLGALVLIEDRSALAVEESRRHRAEQLAAVGELATGVAHEINNPLASIKGFAQLLARDVTGESQVQALDIINRECSRVAGIIDRLLDFAAQQRTREHAVLNLSSLVHGVLDLRRYALETAGIEVQRDLDSSLSPIRGDYGRLQRAVLALVRHTERSLAAQEPGRRVIARTRESTDGVVLYLIDNGPGIPRDELRTLFSSTAPGEDDVGLGLNAAMEIVREHDGHLWADSVEGEGTAFFIRLPRYEEAAAPAVRVSPTGDGRAMRTRALRVLVADDEATLRLAIALFLGRHGHEVVQAADAYEAHRFALAEPFDVVLADARMPGDGVSLLEKLEAIPHLTGRTVLMTGDHAHPFASDALHSGRPHLSKPFDMTEVIHLVETIGR